MHVDGSGCSHQEEQKRGGGRVGLVDAFLFALIAWRIYRISFPWAVAGLVLLLAELVLRIVTHPTSGGVGLLIIIGFVDGVRGTYFLRRERKQQQTTQSPVLPAADASSSLIAGTADSGAVPNE